MRLIVDQAHVHDVLTALTNSRLRIQITQVTLHQAASTGNNAPKAGPPGLAYGMGQPGGAGAPRMPPAMYGSGSGYQPTNSPGPGPGAGSGSRPPGAGSGGMPPVPPGGIPPGGKPGVPPTRPDLGKEKTEASPVQDTVQLVEVVVYGIATLYERPPDPPFRLFVTGVAPQTVQPGKPAKITFAVYRKQGFTGEITVKGGNAPFTIPGTQATAQVDFTPPLSVQFQITDKALAALRTDKVPDAVLKKLEALKAKPLEKAAFEQALGKALDPPEAGQYQALIVKHAELPPPAKTVYPVTFVGTGSYENRDWSVRAPTAAVTIVK
jgi:hypothetical protein